MKKNITEIVIWFIIAIPFALALIYWNRLPDQLAIHFNFQGEADAFGNKTFSVLRLPILNLLIFVVLKLLPKFLLSSIQKEALTKRYDIIRILIHGMITALFCVILMYSLEYTTNVLLLIAYGILVLLLTVGNYLNNIKPNKLIGIKTPWTLKSTEVWRKTHHFTSRLWVVASLIMMCVIPFISELFIARLLIIYFIIIFLPPIYYSYYISKKSITK